MNKNVLSELGELLVSRDKLLDVLASNVSGLDEYPNLQNHVCKKHPNLQAYQRLSREKKQEFFATLDERLGWIVYEMVQDLKLDFLAERAAMLVGDDISKLNSLTVKDLGADLIARYMSLITAAAYSQTEERPTFPWMAEKGRWDPAFWSKADKAYDAWKEGYTSHYKLDNWCQEHLDCRAPQSSVKFFKAFGDPRLLPEWSECYA